MNNILSKTIAMTSVTIATVATSLPAIAASFTPFSFTTNVTDSPATAAQLASNPALLNDPTKDVRLNSVTLNNGSSINQFQLVSGANLIKNDTYVDARTGNTYGILNVGEGPNTPTDPLVTQGPARPNPSNQDIVNTLGNLNLNNIVVTRESANQAILDVSFTNPVNTLLFWERGGTPGATPLVAGDSGITIEALANDGVTVLASYHITPSQYTQAGYNISTIVYNLDASGNIDTSITPLLNNGPFNIGSIGLTLNGFTAENFRLISTGNNLGPGNGDNGPDFKIVGAFVPVPEPSSVVGILVLGGLGIALKRKRESLK